MISRQYIPKNPSPLVDSIWELVAETGDHEVAQPVPPIGMPEMLFFLDGKSPLEGLSARRSILKGQYTQLQSVQFHADFHVLIVRLQPFGLHQLFGIPANDLTDAVMDGEAFLLMQAICDILAVDEPMQDRLQKMILLIARQPLHPISPETLRFLELIPLTSSQKVEEIIHHQGIGLRNLQRNLPKEVGLSPKKYLRILRIIQLHQAMPPDPDWVQFVAEYEFTDQSHLVKEFKQVMRHTPSAFMRNHLDLRQILPPPQDTPF